MGYVPSGKTWVDLPLRTTPIMAADIARIENGLVGFGNTLDALQAALARATVLNYHNAVASTPRIPGMINQWVGSVIPIDAIVGDKWLNLTTGELIEFTASVG